MRSLTLGKLSKLSKKNLSSNMGRRSKWFILTEVVNIMVDMMRRDATLDHLQSTFRNVALMLSLQCLVLLYMVRCMLVNSSLPEFLWGEALKTAAYI